MTAGLVSVCVATYRPHAAPNLSSLATELPAALDGLAGELVVALNGITAAEAGADPTSARMVDLGVNQGVSSGWNAAADAAAGDVLVFANDDLTLGPGAIRQLVQALDVLPDAGVVGARRLRWDLTRRDARRWPELTDPRPTPDPRPAAPDACPAIEGFLFALRRETFVAVGGFDRAYDPCLYEDLDLCIAVRRRLGLEVYEVPGIDHAHRNGVSARRPWPWVTISHHGRREALGAIRRRNRRHFVAKWGDSPPATALRPGRPPG